MPRTPTPWQIYKSTLARQAIAGLAVQGGLINTANGSQIALTEGAIDVDFYFGTFDVNLTYEGQGNTLSALQQDFFNLVQ